MHSSLTTIFTLHNLQFPGKSLIAYVNIIRETVYISNDETTVCLHCPTVSLSHPHFGYQSQRWQLWLWLAGRWFFETIIDETSFGTDTTRCREEVRNECGGCKFKFFCSGGSVTATVCEMDLYGWVFHDVRRPRRPSKIGGEWRRRGWSPLFHTLTPCSLLFSSFRAPTQ